MGKEAIGLTVGSAFPHLESSKERLAQGRTILDNARRYMIPAWVALQEKGISKEEKFRLGGIWANGVREHIIAAQDPISSAKLEEGIYLTQSKVENRARRNMIRMVERRGGIREQGRGIANRLIHLTKIIQARRGVVEDPSFINQPSKEKVIFAKDPCPSRVVRTQQLPATP